MSLVEIGTNISLTRTIRKIEDDASRASLHLTRREAIELASPYYWDMKKKAYKDSFKYIPVLTTKYVIDILSGRNEKPRPEVLLRQGVPSTLTSASV